MNSETLKHLVTWLLLVSTICIVLGSIHEVRNCDGRLIMGMFWWECIPDNCK